MSKKNTRKKIMFDYPVPEKRMVLYSNKVNLDLMKLVPINGNEYNAYDDGKINLSRHYVVKIKNVYNHMYFKRHFPKIYNIWVNEKKEHYWLFKDSTDYFVETTNSYDEVKSQYFVRDKHGGWFSIGYPNMLVGSELDITGNLSKHLINEYTDTDISEKEKKEILNNFV